MKQILKRFFYETFKPRTKEDYGAVLGKNRIPDPDEKIRVPWLYLRVLGCLCVLLAAGLLIGKFVPGNGVTDALRLLGVGAFTFASMILVFEVIPRGSVSLPEYLALSFAGGVISILLIDALNGPIDWDVLDRFCCPHEIAEELCKALPTVALILILKKKDPADGFLIGSAVGAGFNFIEDFGYAKYKGLSTVTETLLTRGCNAPVTHLLWTGLVGFAFLAVKKPWRNFRFYAAFLVSCLEHAIWNFGNEDFLPAFFSSGVFNAIHDVLIAALNLLLWVWLLKRFGRGPEAREDTPADLPDTAGENPPAVCESPGYEPFPYRYKRRLSLAVCAVVLAAEVLASFLLYGETSGRLISETVDLGTVAEFLNDVHDGRDLTVNFNRPYDPAAENVMERREFGEVVYAEQPVECADTGTFIYIYELEDEKLVLSDVKYYSEGLTDPDGNPSSDGGTFLEVIYDETLEDYPYVFDPRERAGATFGVDYIYYFNWKIDVINRVIKEKLEPAVLISEVSEWFPADIPVDASSSSVVAYGRSVYLEDGKVKVVRDLPTDDGNLTWILLAAEAGVAVIAECFVLLSLSRYEKKRLSSLSETAEETDG